MEIAIHTENVKVIAQFPNFKCVIAFNGELYKASLNLEKKELCFDVSKDKIPMR